MSVVPDVGVISLARGIPSPDMLPLDQLATSARRAVENDGRIALNYGPPGGYGPLRQWLADRHGTTANRVLITPGSLIGLNFVVRHFFHSGGRAIVEAPTYDRMLLSLADQRADVVAVDRGDQGLDIERIRQIAAGNRRPGFLYVLPTFHNPTGTTMSRSERELLAETAAEHDLLVFEDDPYGLLRVDGEPQPYMHELLRERGRDDLVVFSSSFSKTVAPGLRVGYLLLPEGLVAPLEALATQTYVSPPLLPQAQLLEFLCAGYLEPHLEFLRSSLRLRRDAVLATFDERMPQGARWTRPDGGYFLWLELPEGVDAAILSERARKEGVTFVPGAGFFADGRGCETARISFSYPSVEDVREGAERLARAVYVALEGPRSP